jgi:hypothetical protein
LTLTGRLLSNGGHTGVGYANGLNQTAGPGGGGSGGNIELHAGILVIAGSAAIQARGGAGGGLSYEPVAFDPFFYSCGAHGGQGYLLVNAGSLTLDPAAGLDVAVEIRPVLGIRLDGAVTVLHWPAPSTGYVLQESPDLTGLAWSDVSLPVTVVDSENRVTVPPISGSSFYRLALRSGL